LLSHTYLRRLQREPWIVKIMCAGAQIGFLGNNRPGTNFDLSQAIRVGAIAKTGPVMECEVPGNLDARPLMNKRPTMDFGAEKAQPEQPPPVQRFGCPLAKKTPTVFPQQQRNPLS